MEDSGDTTNVNMFLWAGISILACVFIHILYKIFSNKKKDEIAEEAEKRDEEPLVEETAETATTENRPAKNKKRAPWKGKSEFTHPWLLKNLKGHPGTVLHMDFSPNGKFLAATCEANIALLDILSSSNDKMFNIISV